MLGTHDAFFMTLLYLRNYSTFLELGRCFRLKENTAKDTVQRVLMAIHDPLFNALVRPLGKAAQVAEGKIGINSIGIAFPDFPQVALVVDCTFQTSNRMRSNFNERKLFFSGKHFQYGIKRELAHLPNGMSK